MKLTHLSSILGSQTCLVRVSFLVCISVLYLWMGIVVIVVMVSDVFANVIVNVIVIDAVVDTVVVIDAAIEAVLGALLDVVPVAVQDVDATVDSSKTPLLTLSF